MTPIHEALGLTVSLHLGLSGVWRQTATTDSWTNEGATSAYVEMATVSGSDAALRRVCSRGQSALWCLPTTWLVPCMGQSSLQQPRKFCAHETIGARFRSLGEVLITRPSLALLW